MLLDSRIMYRSCGTSGAAMAVPAASPCICMKGDLLFDCVEDRARYVMFWKNVEANGGQWEKTQMRQSRREEVRVSGSKWKHVEANEWGQFLGSFHGSATGRFRGSRLRKRSCESLDFHGNKKRLHCFNEGHRRFYESFHRMKYAEGRMFYGIDGSFWKVPWKGRKLQWK